MNDLIQEIELTDEQLESVTGGVEVGHREDHGGEDDRHRKCGHWEEEREWDRRRHRWVWDEVWVPCGRR